MDKAVENLHGQNLSIGGHGEGVGVAPGEHGPRPVDGAVVQASVAYGDDLTRTVGGEPEDRCIASNGALVGRQWNQCACVHVDGMHAVGAQHQHLPVTQVHFKVDDGDHVGNVDDVNGRGIHGSVNDENPVVHGQPKPAVVRVNGTCRGFEGQRFERNRGVGGCEGLHHKVGDGGSSRKGPTGRQAAG